MELIFDETHRHRALPNGHVDDIPNELLRDKAAALPAASELHVVRHYTRLSQQNFSIDTHFYPLGSCTMKYNPRACNRLAMLPAFLGRHPLGDAQFGQGFMHCLYDVQEWLSEITGLEATSLVPMAGAQGEFAGVAMIRAYHQSRQDTERTEILVPDAAHGTNPASAVMCGFKVREIPCNGEGDIDPEVLRTMVGPQTAGIMLTNPSTLGVFERHIQEVADIVHQAGGLLYYDGANLNAIMGKVRPGDMGFDVVHINLHKTFSTPHGGGGPGSGPVCVSKRLVPFLPVPFVAQENDCFVWQDEASCPQTIGRLSAFMGNAGVLLRAWVYMQLLGGDGLKRVSDYATLNANYLMKRLSDAGFELAYPNRRATHEFIITLKTVAEEHHISAMDVAKRLLDYGYHAPTTYFPLLIPECLLIEPTETESKATLDAFVEAMIAILKEIETDPDKLKNAPISQPVRRLDEVKAAREPDLAYKGING
jgi:glycine dehydrogenase subunit 2